MDLQIIPVQQFQNFLLCLARVLALITAIPVFTGSQFAGQIRVGLAFATTLLLFPLMSPHTPEVPFTFAGFGLLMVHELLLGALLGLIAQLIFAGVTFGGTIIGYQMGFAAANIFDPQTTQQLSLMSQFQNIIALLFFLAFDVHHLFFKVIVESYTVLPPGLFNFHGEAVPRLSELAGHMFVLGVKFSAPVIVMLLLSNLVLGVLTRVFPQLNVFMLSFPKNIGVAFLVIGLTMNVTATILRQEFDTMGVNFLEFFHLLQ